MSRRIAADGARRARRWVLWSVTGALVLLSAVALIAVAPYVFLVDIDDVAPGSLAWHLVLPSFLTAAPAPAACRDARYALHLFDGLKPTRASVHFQTRASPAELQPAYARELATCRPEPGEADGSHTLFQCNNSEYHTVILSLDPGDGCRDAFITFMSD